MLMGFDGQTPIYAQLAERIEDAILADTYGEEAQIPSTTEMALGYQINPATALKAVNILVDEGIVYKKRGLGMFVAKGARETIYGKRKAVFREKFIAALLMEAEKLSISRQELLAMIQEA